jgi:hypothetical protein
MVAWLPKKDFIFFGSPILSGDEPGKNRAFYLGARR